MEWFYAHNGQQAGPVSETDLEELARTGVVTADTLVWHAGMSEWQAYRTIQQGGSVETKYCNSCGNQFPVSELAMFGESAVCMTCKPGYVQRLRQGMTSTAPPLFRYAGFWIRFCAYVIDAIILGAVRYAITIPLGLEYFFRPIRPGFQFAYLGTAAVIGYALNLAYVVYFWTQQGGATPGKMAFGLKVVRPDGGPISVGQAVGRYFGYILDGITIGIGFMMAGWDDEKRGLHDRICDTRVIRTR